ncbi:MAG: NifU N-terminal domain-containing protein [Candidatus Omnitrophica bacterium]|nr:NifU N-terminal domain-containing protein [Candidatus Omnitrophota bacterium]
MSIQEPIDVIVEPTPNPNSIKFTLTRKLVEKSETYSSLQEAEKSPLAKILLQIPGVKTLFILNNFISVGKDPAADWEEIVPKVEGSLREFFK